MNLPPPPPPPPDDDSIMTQFKPVQGQWELTEDNIKRIDPKNGQTILHNYCKHINTTPLEVYRYLIEIKGCDVNIQDNNKDTPPIYALQYFGSGDSTILTYLLSRKDVNVSIKGNYGYTILHTACDNINKLPHDIFKLLIETMGFDVTVKNTSLLCAIDSFNPNNGGDITVLRYLLTQKDINVSIKTNSGYTILHYACERINTLPLEIFRVLIETMGCDVNAQANNKDTPLHRATSSFIPSQDARNVATLTYLLTQTNINVDTKGKHGYTLLHIACQRITKLPLDVFKLLIETMGFDVNVQAENKDTPLHISLCNFDSDNGGDINVLTYLINQENVNVNIRGEHGYTLLHYACKNINSLSIDIFRALIETMDCGLNVQDENNDTPIHLAFCNFDSDNDGVITILTYLLSRKSINFDIKGQYDRNLLHWASVCDIAPDSDDDFTDLDDDFTDSDDDLSDLNDFDDSNNSVEAKGDTLFHPVIEVIVETCLEQILDETRF